MNNNHPMFDDYMMNARNNHQYDFKSTNGTGSKIDGIDHYRGMPIGVNKNGQIVFASARDIGNMAAGYIAAINGMTWGHSRMAFDAYESVTKGYPTIEGVSTQRAEFYGWRMGYNRTGMIEKANNFLESVSSLFSSISNFIF